MTHWDDLGAELDAWSAAGRTATLWWRDDDAAEPSAALDRLLGIVEAHGTPLTLAVIPAAAQDSLRRALAGRGGVTPVQHG
jgi:hypothetical protein